MKPAGRVRRRESMGEGDLEDRDEKGQCTVRAGDVRQPIADHRPQPARRAPNHGRRCSTGTLFCAF